MNVMLLLDLNELGSIASILGLLLSFITGFFVGKKYTFSQVKDNETTMNNIDNKQGEININQTKN